MDNNYTIEQICACHDFLLEQDPDFWSQNPISLQSILKRIDFFLKKKPKTTKEVLDSIPNL